MHNTTRADSVTFTAIMPKYLDLQSPLSFFCALRLKSTPWARKCMVAALFLSLIQTGCWIRSFDASARPDLVLITIDSLRADHLELYGHTRPTAPNLLKLGRAGVTFKHAVAAAPWTLPSMASIHTGLPPSRHGATSNQSAIGKQHPAVASLLQASGYQTRAVVSHVFVGSSFGFARGFDDFNERHVQDHSGSSSEVLTQVALESFNAAGDGPTFLWVHYFDPHYSYERHPEYDFATGRTGRFGDSIDFESPNGTELLGVSAVAERYMIDVYDEEIAHTDKHVGALIDGVIGAGRDRGVIFVVTADHGEGFLDHNRFGHGRDLYDELIHVPLIIGGDIPRTMWGLSIGSPVETSSIATTLLQFAGVEEHTLRGMNLFDTALSRSTPSYVSSEGSYASGTDQRQVSVERGRWKMIQHLDNGRVELYNRHTDPGEQNNIAGDPKVARVQADMRAIMDIRLAEIPSPGTAPETTPNAKTAPAQISKAEREKLKALGYLESEGTSDAVH